MHSLCPPILLRRAIPFGDFNQHRRSAQCIACRSPIRHAIESGRVPSPPQILLRLLQTGRRRQHDHGQTGRGSSSRIPGLCTRVLTAANSPAIRRGTQLQSIENCLIALGTRLVRSIATCLSVQNLFDERAGHADRSICPPSGAHSLLVAELSRSLAATATGYPPTGRGLPGRTAARRRRTHSALGSWRTLPASFLPPAPAKRTLSETGKARHFSVHHGEIGTWLADQWHLDSPFADGILFHHLPAEQITDCRPSAASWYGWRTRAGFLRQTAFPRNWQQVANARCLPISTTATRLSTPARSKPSSGCASSPTPSVLPRSGPERLPAADRTECHGYSALAAARSEPDANEQLADNPWREGFAATLAAATSVRASTSDAEVLLSLRESAYVYSVRPQSPRLPALRAAKRPPHRPRISPRQPAIFGAGAGSLPRRTAA
jgi:hypothetical protein